MSNLNLQNYFTGTGTIFRPISVVPMKQPWVIRAYKSNRPTNNSHWNYSTGQHNTTVWMFIDVLFVMKNVFSDTIYPSFLHSSFLLDPIIFKVPYPLCIIYHASFDMSQLPAHNTITITLYFIVTFEVSKVSDNCYSCLVCHVAERERRNMIKSSTVITTEPFINMALLRLGHGWVITYFVLCGMQ